MKNSKKNTSMQRLRSISRHTDIKWQLLLYFNDANKIRHLNLSYLLPRCHLGLVLVRTDVPPEVDDVEYRSRIVGRYRVPLDLDASLSLSYCRLLRYLGYSCTSSTANECTHVLLSTFKMRSSRDIAFCARECARGIRSSAVQLQQPLRPLTVYLILLLIAHELATR